MTRILYTLLLLLPFNLCAQIISISSASDTACAGDTVFFSASASGVASPHYRWKVNGMNVGTDSTAFSSNTFSDHDAISCQLINSTGDTIFAISDTIVITVQNFPDAGTIIATDTNVCTGTTIVLSATTPGGVWSSGRATTVSNGVVTAVGREYWGPLPDTIKYTITNSCGASVARRVVYVRSVPYAAVNVASSVCVGESAPFYEENYIQNIYSTTGNVTVAHWGIIGVSEGGDKIINITSNMCGSDTGTADVFVYPPFTSQLTAPEKPLCVGETVTVNEDIGVGYMRWTQTGNFVKTNYFTITGIKPGTDTLTLDGLSRCHTTFNKSIIVHVIGPDSIIAPKPPICTNTSVFLKNEFPNGVWSNYNHALATIDINSGVLTALKSGIDTVFYMLSNGCSTKIPITISPTPDPIPMEKNVCLTSDIDIPLQGNGVWVSNDTSVAYFDPVFYPGKIVAKKPGIAVIQYTLAGCFTTLPLRVIDCNKNFSLFPNPAKDLLIIMAKTYDYREFSLLSTSGQLLLHGMLNGYFTEINTASLPKGAYLISLTGNSSSALKFVKD